MSNKSGISDQIVSVPSGGGALRGIGEKFSPDLHTGTGNFTISIALSRGRYGFQPKVGDILLAIEETSWYSNVLPKGNILTSYWMLQEKLGKCLHHILIEKIKYFLR